MSLTAKIKAKSPHIRSALRSFGGSKRSLPGDQRYSRTPVSDWEWQHLPGAETQLFHKGDKSMGTLAQGGLREFLLLGCSKCVATYHSLQGTRSIKAE